MLARTTALNPGTEAFFRGTQTIRENRVRYQCNIPWLICLTPPRPAICTALAAGRASTVIKQPLV